MKVDLNTILTIISFICMIASIVGAVRANTYAKKAKALNLDITANVEFGREDVPIPTEIYLYGNASPYAKYELTRYITEQLGIPEENQVWN